MNIPLVDLALYTNGTDAQKVQFSNDLGKAFEEVGFVAVKNHGIDQQLIDRVYATVKAFFELPYDVKKKYEIAGLAGQRGYTSFGKEHAKGSDAPDLKEFFQYGQTVEKGEVSPEAYPDNVRVSEIAHFNQLFLDTYRAFEKSGSSLLKIGRAHV